MKLNLAKATFLVSLLISLVVLFGCASGQLSTLPEIEDVSKAATLTVIRESRLAGSAVSFRVAIDEQNIAMVENGTHIVFKVNPGNHTLSFSIWQAIAGGWIVMDRIEVNCIAKEQYFFKFGLGITDNKMDLITREEAMPLIAQTKYLALE